MFIFFLCTLIVKRQKKKGLTYQKITYPVPKPKTLITPQGPLTKDVNHFHHTLPIIHSYLSKQNRKGSGNILGLLPFDGIFRYDGNRFYQYQQVK